jgi:hypothetical protein
MQFENYNSYSKRQKLESCKPLEPQKMGPIGAKKLESFTLPTEDSLPRKINSNIEPKKLLLPTSKHFEEAIQKAQTQGEYLKKLLELRQKYFSMIIGIYYKIILKSKIERSTPKTKSCFSLLKTMVNNLI